MAEYEERIDGPTPNGGVYSIAYFQDAKGRLVSKEGAEAVEIKEFNEEGVEVHRTYMELRRT